LINGTGDWGVPLKERDSQRKTGFGVGRSVEERRRTQAVIIWENFIRNGEEARKWVQGRGLHNGP